MLDDGVGQSAEGPGTQVSEIDRGVYLLAQEGIESAAASRETEGIAVVIVVSCDEQQQLIGKVLQRHFCGRFLTQLPKGSSARDAAVSVRVEESGVGGGS